MKVFVTGASGWIASAVIPELVAAGHTVFGLARSDSSAPEVERRGATAVRGSLTDLDVLRQAATDADGVIHLAFGHSDMNDMTSAADMDRASVEAMLAALAGTGKPMVIASGTPTVAGRASTEDDAMASVGPAGARAENERMFLQAADRGVRTSVVRLPRSVHGRGDKHGFIVQLAGMFRQAGQAMYVGDGANRWCAVHVLDAGHLFRLALEEAPAGTPLHAVGDEGIPARVFTEALADRMGLPVVSVEADRLGFFGVLESTDHATTAAKTRALLGWGPTHPGLLDDIAAGVYDQ